MIILKRLLMFTAVVAVVLGGAGTALAAPKAGTVGADNAALREAITGFYQSELNGNPAYRDVDNFGEAIASGYFGNTANVSDHGNGVTPSLAPGPWVCVYVAGSCVDKTMGTTWGELVSDFRAN